MKRVVTIVSLLFCGVIVFFSIMGERLYYLTKPTVELDRPIRVNDMALLPETAVLHDDDGDYIFTATAETGFSTEILTVTKIPLTSCLPDEIGYLGEGYVFVEAEGYRNDLTVYKASKELKDGMRVVEGTIE